MNTQELYTYFLKSSGVATDTRKIEKDSLFVCLKGTNFNGNKFASEALKKGASYVIIDDPEYLENNNRFLFVENALKCLQELAHHHRMQFNIPVIGLTGSNGKTTTKELINSVLSQHFKTTATKGNLNNHIGVPLTLLEINSETEIALIEMGANHLKEIEFLSNIAAPTIGYITNFGKAHLEGFGSLEGVIKGKSELYQFLANNEGVCLINLDDKKQIELTLNQETISFGSSNEATTTIHREARDTDRKIDLTVDEVEINSQLKGDYNFSNIAAAIAFGNYFKIPIHKIKKGIEEYTPTNNRSEWYKTKTNTLILDAYNANPSSMDAALKSFFSSSSQGKIVILGDMLELGVYAKKEHQKIVDLIEKQKLEEVILVGAEFYKTRVRTSNFQKFEATENVIPFIQKKNFQNKNILIKGSRGIALEALKEYL